MEDNVWKFLGLSAYLCPRQKKTRNVELGLKHSFDHQSKLLNTSSISDDKVGT